jgi:hypothetical protein
MNCQPFTGSLPSILTPVIDATNYSATISYSNLTIDPSLIIMLMWNGGSANGSTLSSSSGQTIIYFDATTMSTANYTFYAQYGTVISNSTSSVAITQKSSIKNVVVNGTNYSQIIATATYTALIVSSSLKMVLFWGGTGLKSNSITVGPITTSNGTTSITFDAGKYNLPNGAYDFYFQYGSVTSSTVSGVQLTRSLNTHTEVYTYLGTIPITVPPLIFNTSSMRISLQNADYLQNTNPPLENTFRDLAGKVLFSPLMGPYAFYVTSGLVNAYNIYGYFVDAFGNQIAYGPSSPSSIVLGTIDFGTYKTSFTTTNVYYVNGGNVIFFNLGYMYAYSAPNTTISQYTFTDDNAGHVSYTKNAGSVTIASSPLTYADTLLTLSGGTVYTMTNGYFLPPTTALSALNKTNTYNSSTFYVYFTTGALNVYNSADATTTVYTYVDTGYWILNLNSSQYLINYTTSGFTWGISVYTTAANSNFITFNASTSVHYSINSITIYFSSTPGTLNLYNDVDQSVTSYTYTDSQRGYLIVNSLPGKIPYNSTSIIWDSSNTAILINGSFTRPSTRPSPSPPPPIQPPGFMTTSTFTGASTFNYNHFTITGTGFTQSLVGMYANMPTVSTYLFYIKRCTTTTIYGYFVDYKYKFTPMSAWSTPNVSISGFTYGPGQTQTQNILVDGAGGFSVLKFTSNRTFDIIYTDNTTYSYTFVDAGNGNANSLTFTSGPEDWFNVDVFGGCTNIPITYSPTTTPITSATTVTFTCTGPNYTYIYSG